MAKDVIKRINKLLMANGIKTDDPFYQALWGKEDYKPNPTIDESSDYKCGAIANELEYAVAHGDIVSRPESVTDLPDLYKKIFVRFFAGHVLTTTQDVQQVVDLMYGATLRNGYSSWLTKWAILESAGYYFDRDFTWINENKITGSNLFTNPDFESSLSSWSTTQSGSTTVSRSTAAPFEESYSMEFSVDSSQSSGTLEQTVTGVTAATHFLNFFLKDDGNADADDVLSVEVVRTGGDGYYYNFSTRSWQSNQAETKVTKDTSGGRFEVINLFVVATTSDDLTIRFKNTGNSTVAHTFYVDYVEFGVKDNPHIELLIVSQGTSADYMAPWESGADPTSSFSDSDYENYGSYFDQSHIGGYLSGSTANVFEEIMGISTPAGVQYTISTISRAV